MTGREELERGVAVDFKAVGEFLVLVSIHFSNHHILPELNEMREILHSGERIRHNLVFRSKVLTMSTPLRSY